MSQSVQTPSQVKGEKRRKENSKFVNGLKLVLAGLCVLMVLFVVFFPDDKKASTAEAPTETQAILIAQDKVKAQLKSPSTADFELMNGKAVSLGDGRFTVRDHVDSQNSFGATVRSEYEVQLHYNSGDWSDPNNWTVDKMTVN